jgi:hypothetical protein
MEIGMPGFAVIHSGLGPIDGKAIDLAPDERFTGKPPEVEFEFL